MSDTATISAALVKALTDLTNVVKAHKAENAPGKHTFANIADVISETRPVLAEHDLVCLTPIHEHGDGLACTVVLLHASGERLDFGPFTFPHGKDAQATGSWVTYIRRYAMLAALGMGAEDDDGAGAHAAQTAPKRQERPQETPPGKPKAQVKGDLVTYLTGKVPEGTEKDHAAQVWTDAEVKVIDGKWVAPDEVSVLMATAKDHAENLAAVNA
jgi:hypothetical protein